MTLRVRVAIVRGALDVAQELEDWPAIAEALKHVSVPRAMSGWMPFRAIADVDDAILSVCGEAVVEDVHRRAANPTLRSTVFKPLVENAFHFFGRTPSALLRWTPAAVRMSLREVSDVMYEDRENGCRLTMPHPDPEIRASASWRAGTRGSLKGIVETVGYEAVVKEALTDDALIHEISWKRIAPKT